MFIIGNRSDFERRLREAVARGDALRQFPPQYLDDLRLVSFDGAMALIEVPSTGRMARALLMRFLELDLGPQLRDAFELCGEPVRGINFSIRI